LLAAVIPPDVVCGNKVPTLAFDVAGMSADDTALLWVAMANSIAVDWAVRRVITTSINYFVLRALPLPVVTLAQRRKIIAAARELRAAEGDVRYGAWQVGGLRAEVDSLVAAAFDLTVEDVQLMFTDFRLIDRGQPPLAGESRSTVTRDMTLALHARKLGVDGCEWQDRADRAYQLGAAPYVPADYV
jgi:hypothetical protein